MQTGTNFSDSFTTIYEDELPFLEKTVKDFPASPFALFLLLQSYKRTENARFKELEQKAAVYFPNTNWLQYQLSGPPSIESIPEQSLSSKEQDEEVFVENADESGVTSVFPPDQESDNSNQVLPEKDIEKAAIAEMEKEEMVEFVQGEEAENFEDSYVAEEIKKETITDDSSETNKIAETEIEKNEDGETDDSEEIVQGDHSTATIPDQEVKSEESEFHSEETSSDTKEASSKTENQTGSPEELSTSPAPIPFKKFETAEESQDLEFEPLHTIDYFASQGIIIPEEALMDDKLGKQVKSFTDWLKSMKKLHPGKLPEQNEVVEKIIQSSAELSNEDAGILTESMAEVLLKQGKREKAIEMFEKLSLMNPSKSIYFAAKIESLKNK
ncbi:MAG: hypothetical protein ABIN48_07130 [Ginsengibacter sp.]